MQKVIVGGVPEHFNYPWHYAIENHLFQKRGIEIEWIDYPAGTGAMCSSLRNNQLDLAIVLTEGIVADIIKGNEAKLIQPYVISPLLWGIHVPAHSSLEEPEDIKGKTYAISRFGSGSHLMAFVDSDERGWNSNELKFLPIENLQGAINSFKEGSSEVFFWEKYTTQPYVDSGNFRRIGIRPTPWPCFMIAGRNDFLIDHSNIVNSISEIIIEASILIMKNAERSCKEIVKRYQLNADQVTEWFSLTQWAQNSKVESSIIEHVMETLFKLNLINKKDKAENLIYS